MVLRKNTLQVAVTKREIAGGLILLLLGSCGTIVSPARAAADSTGLTVEIGAEIEPFTLKDWRGRVHHLADYADADYLVLAFLGTECPLAKLYARRLTELAREYESRKVRFLGINANCQDSVTEIEAYVRRHEIGFPVLKDLGNRVADSLGAQRTPEVFLLDQERRIRYWGRIDDQYGVGYTRERPAHFALKTALDELLAGQTVSQPLQPSAGCRIGRLRPSIQNAPVTYSNQVARILQKHCVECHREGEIAPFSLTEYDEVAGWSETIAEVIQQRRMPPWHAHPDYGEFVNARTMSDEEQRLIYQWVSAGAPQGDPDRLPPPRQFITGWRLPRPPDLVIPMRGRPFQVPAQGTVEYQYFVVDPGFREDKWVLAAEVVPGNRSVVHHAIVFTRPPGGIEREGSGWLSAYVPGNARLDVDEEYARLIPAGSKLIFQLHYTPVGVAQPDTTKLGLVFADPARVKKRLMTLLTLQRDFEIPPHAASFRVESSFNDFPGSCELLALGPHMHLRGRSFRFVAHRKGQAAEVLLDVPQYDFNWQHVYQLKEAIPAGDGLTIQCVARFDNSLDNRVNPDPGATVRWGDQTWEEMMLGFLEVAVPVEAGHGTDRLAQQRKSRAARAAQKAQQMFRRFDRSGDRRLQEDEVPETFMVFAFRRIDANTDGLITFEEAVAWQSAEE